MAQPRKKTAAKSQPISDPGAPGYLEPCNAIMFKSKGRYLGFLAIVSIGAALLVLFFFCPNFNVWLGLEYPLAWTDPAVNRAISTFKQIDNPFAPISDRSNWVIAWRLLFPLIWHYLALPKWLFLFMPPLGCILTLGLIAHIVFQRTSNRWWTFLATVLMGACSWFFVSSAWLTYFDSWVMLGLLVLAFSKSRTALVLACLLTPWIEERFLLAAPLCMVIRCLDVGTEEHRQTKELLRDGIAILVSCLTYPLLRVFLARWGLGAAEVGAYVGMYFTWEHITSVSPIRYLDGAWSALRAGWFFVFILFWSLWVSNRRPISGVLAIILFGTIAVGLVVAADLSRNICSVAPVMLMGVLDLARQRPDMLRIALPTVVVVNLLLPASHVLTTFKLPIFNIYIEMEHLENPPAFLIPDYYTQQGIQLVNKGKYDEANLWFDFAFKLDRNNVPAYRARSIMWMRLGNLKNAAEDAEHAVSLDLNDYEAYFIRAVVRERCQNPLGAISDLRKALDIAPEEWNHRQDALGFLNKLSSEQIEKGSSTPSQ